MPDLWTPPLGASLPDGVILFPGTDLARGPSPNLSWEEMNCNDGTPYPEDWRLERAIPLAYEFQLIRRQVGGPIHIGSAFRSETWNRKNKGARKSQHVQGRALDLTCPRELAISDFLDLVLLVADRGSSRIKGIGIYPSFIHIDTRPTSRRARWSGSRATAELLDRVA